MSRAGVLVLVLVLASLWHVSASAQADSSVGAVSRDGVAPWQTGDSRAEDLVVTLVTFGPGDDIVSMFGHSAIIVEDRRLQRSRLYNFGHFSFETGLMLTYALGDLRFWAADAPVERTLENYQRENRDVRLAELALAPEQALLAAQLLVRAVAPAHRYYQYDHYLDNCSTRIRDVINVATGGSLNVSTPARQSLRQHTRRYAQAVPWLAFGFDVALGPLADRPLATSGEAFLPDELEAQVMAAHVMGPTKSEPLVRQRVERFRAARDRPPAEPMSFVWPALTLSLLWSVLLGWFAIRGQPAALTAASLLASIPLAGIGLLLVGFSVFTTHASAQGNHNLLLTVPHLLAVPPLLMSLWAGPRQHTLVGLYLGCMLGVVGCVLLKLWSVQDNAGLMALAAPLSVALAYSWWRVGR
jgi:hypothetical protein